MTLSYYMQPNDISSSDSTGFEDNDLVGNLTDRFVIPGLDNVETNITAENSTIIEEPF